jgi:hypothetical protein
MIVVPDSPPAMVSSVSGRVVSAKVAHIIDQYRVVLNVGAKDGVAEEQRFLIYEIGPEVFDPDTKESLGLLKIVKGIGVVTSVDERMATLESVEREEVERRPHGLLFSPLAPLEVSKVRKPFRGAKVGDVARAL